MPYNGRVCIAAARKCLCVGNDVRLFAQRNEYRRIIVSADARITARNDVHGRGGAGAIGGEDFGDRFGHLRLHLAQQAGPVTASALACTAIVRAPAFAVQSVWRKATEVLD